jgi:diaminopimelate decarboxylase
MADPHLMKPQSTSTIPQNRATERLALFPITTRVKSVQGSDCLTIAGLDLADLTKRYGTPLYLYDQATLQAAVSAYRQALAHSYPGETGITYAGKAFLCLAMVQWLREQDLWVDCTGAGEIHVAVTGGVSRERILVHGVNKSQADLDAALTHAGTIVVDNLAELDRLAEQARHWQEHSFPTLWLRIRPGLAVETHAFTQTGQPDSKFGMSQAEVLEAIRLCSRRGLPLTGLHFHQGSHFHDPSPIGPAMATALDLVVSANAESGWLPQAICPGGGWGVPYHEDDLPHPSVKDYVEFIAGHLIAGCRERGLPLPRLQLEPGRSLVAQAGVSLYRVGAVKHTQHRRWLLLDGGMTDNPRPALYGARYSALPVWEPGRSPTGPAWLAGPYCESSDVLIEALPMPDLQPGELVAVPVSGAYHLSMGNNYNGARKPAVVWLDDAQGVATLIQERETLEDLLRRDRPL